MKKLTSTSNKTVKDWGKLKTKKGRVSQNKYMLEGWHLVKEAIANYASINEIIYTEEFKHLDELPKLEDVEFIQISDNVETYISSTSTPQGIFATITLDNQNNYVDELDGAWLFLDNVQNPGNIGTMVRTADAAGFKGVVFGNQTVDMYNPKLVRSMQGSQFHVKVLRGDLSKWIANFKEKGYPVFGTELNPQARQYNEVGRHDNFALIMGNEGNGMDKELLQKTSLNLYIPITGKAESLNVAVAAGILMFALRR